MELADSHCHLHLLNFNEQVADLRSVLTAAKSNHIHYLLSVGTTLLDVPELIAIAKEDYQFDLRIHASVGLHPNEPREKENEPSIEEIVALSQHEKIVAIGETGLDYYRTENATGDWSSQQQRFRHHIQAAHILKKPLIIHTRFARQDTLKILKEENAFDIGGVFHCFTEDWETAKAALDLGFYVSFSGIVTFKNAVELKEVAKRLPLDRMLIETDSPYLAPHPHRGKMNQPSLVKYVAEHISQLKDIPIEEVAYATTENYKRLFKI